MNSSKCYFVTLLLIFQISICFCDNDCESRTNCSSCIRDIDCIWCYTLSDDLESNKCVAVSEAPDICYEKIQVNPIAEYNILQDEEAQIRPQIINMNMRPGASFKFTLTYTETKDYPVDLYFLMDISASMVIHRNRLSKLGIKISEKMKSLTKETRLGFGSFVDKPERPFVNTYPPKLKNPCSTLDCDSPYSFKNHLPLTEDAERFTQVVNQTKVSANLDSPEGGLEALMQVLACDENIGWREKARRLIIISTDDIYHIAGDGKLVGILEPNDGKCHMAENVYTHALLQDYPSIGQIHAKAQESNMIIIFAVTQSVYETYSKLTEVIRDARLVLLSEDSENIVDLLDDIYKNITDTVQFSHTFDENFEVKLASNVCLQTEDLGLDFTCRNVTIGQPIEITVEITQISCPANGAFHKKYSLKPSGLNENITFHVSMMCDCTCEHGGVGYEENSTKCNEAGDFGCGICQCHPNKQGLSCDCEGDEQTLSERCVDKTTGAKCSGQGTCLCGVCKCEERNNKEEVISGEHCECDNFSCTRHNDELCSGNGDCFCNECICKEGWSGSGCDCSTDTYACIEPKSNEICSSNGDCDCNSCKCHEKNGHKYYGDYCEFCDTCAEECNELEPIVEKLAFGTKQEKMKFQQENALINLTIVGEIPEYNCTFFDEEYCSSKILLTKSALILDILVEEKKCTTGASASVILPIIISTIIAAGLLLLLIWKALTYYYDRREFKKFLLAKQNSKWQNEENPLFVKATSTFSNPLYGNEK